MITCPSFFSTPISLCINIIPMYHTMPIYNNIIITNIIHGESKLSNCKHVTFVTLLSDSTTSTSTSVVVPAAVGSVLAISVIISIILVIIMVVLLIRGKGSCSGTHSPQSYKVKEEALDIEMKPNSVYDLLGGRIATETNEAYGVSQPNPPPNEAYEYVNPIVFDVR